MTTKLGAVSIPITLDLSEANRQIDELERRAVDLPIGEGGPGMQARQATGARTTSRGGPEASWMGRGPSPARQMTQRQIQNHFSKQETQQGQRNALMGNLRATAAMQAGLRAPTDISGVPSKPPGFVQAAAKRLGLAGAESMTPTTALALAAGIYLAGSTVAKAAPTLAPGVESALDTAMPQWAKDAVLAVHNAVQGFEAKIASLKTGYDRTQEMRSAVARVSGKLPSVPIPGLTSSSAYYAMFAELDLQNKMLDNAFDRLKNQEIAVAAGKYIREAAKAVMGR